MRPLRDGRQDAAAKRRSAAEAADDNAATGYVPRTCPACGSHHQHNADGLERRRG